MIEPEGYDNKMPQRMLTVKEVTLILNVHCNTVRFLDKCRKEHMVLSQKGVSS